MNVLDKRCAVKKPWMSTVLVMGMVVVASLQIGCDPKTSLWRGLTNPTALVKSPEDPYIMPINPTASAADVIDDLPPNATAPTMDDLVLVPEDYRIGPEDVVDISVLDLFHEGLETVLRRQVSRLGVIELPMAPSIRASGLTATELRDRIIEAYSPDVLRNPTVSVAVAVQRAATFSIGGAIERPGTYNKTRPDMRLLEAFNLAGTPTQTNIPYILIIRPVPVASEEVAAPRIPSFDGGSRGSITDELPDLLEGLIRPSDLPEPAEEFDAPVPTETQALTAGGGDFGYGDDIDEEELDRLMRGESQPGDADVFAPSTTRYVESAAGSAESPQHETAAGPQPTRIPTPSVRPEDALDWERALGVDNTRVIAIDLKKLRDGSDPRLNIIVRENDIIMIPQMDAKEFYMYGEVNRPGVYTLTGRRITVKMALAAAGGLGALAWPENATLIRRIGPNQEQTIPLNIENIMLGKQADYFLKADDQICVGTNFQAQYMLVLRNAFRLTYGFGFIYDRNFASAAPRGLDSHRFTRW